MRRTELSTHRGAFQCDGLPLTTHIPSAIILALLRPACLPPPPPPPPAPAELRSMYGATRQEGLGSEVARRILMGTYALSAGYYDAYYKRAQQVSERAQAAAAVVLPSCGATVCTAVCVPCRSLLRCAVPSFCFNLVLFSPACPPPPAPWTLPSPPAWSRCAPSCSVS